MPVLKGRFTSSFENAEQNVTKVMEHIAAESCFASREQMMAIDFAVREFFNNAVEHGNKADCCKLVFYRIQWTETFIEVTVRDQGGGFDLGDAIRRDRAAGVDSIRSRGLLAVLRLNWSVSVQGSEVTARLECKKKKENPSCKS